MTMLDELIGMMIIAAWLTLVTCAMVMLAAWLVIMLHG